MGIHKLLRLIGRLFEEREDVYVYCERDALDTLSQMCEGTAADNWFFASKGAQESLGIGGDPSFLTVHYMSADGR